MLQVPYPNWAWNVRIMYQTGKAHQVAGEMKTLGLPILRVSKIRWIGAGKVQLASGKIELHSGLGCDNAPHEKRGGTDPFKECWQEPGTNLRVDNHCQV